MAQICPATGHVVEHVVGPRCQDHGGLWFSECPGCQALWPVGSASRQARVTRLHNSDTPRPILKASSFCAHCGRPGSWLGRDDLMDWVRHEVQGSMELSAASRVELMAVLDRVKDMEPTDERAAPGWKRLHDLAPKAFAATKSVREALMQEGVRRALDALLGP